MIIAYWNIRARVEPVHLMLEYLGLDYERKSYELPNLGLTSQEDYLKLEWFQQKWNMGLDHPNLPYLIEGEVKISQTTAVLKYIARKGDRALTPKRDTEIINCEMAEGAVMDIWSKFYQMVYNPDFENLKKAYLEAEVLTQTFGALDKVLGNRKWLGGDFIKYIDFQLAEILDHIILMHGAIFDDFPNIKSYHENFFSQSKIKVYRESNRFKKWPLYAPAATWGGKNEEHHKGTAF